MYVIIIILYILAGIVSNFLLQLLIFLWSKNYFFEDSRESLMIFILFIIIWPIVSFMSFIGFILLGLKYCHNKIVEII